MSTISIKLDGVDITDDVIITTAKFAMGTNGSPGQCEFEIRDDSHVYSPIAGKEITLDVDGVRCWLGHAIKLARGYWLPVVDTTGDPGVISRRFLVTGNDINYQAFSKRIAYRPSDPTKPTLPPPAAFRCSSTDGEWAEGTRVDDTALYLLRNYTDLVTDGITFDISDFGTPNPDECATYSGAMTVGQLMTDLNRLLMGIFYVRPNRQLRYHDADTVTSSKVLTDRPTPGDPNDIGPRDYKALRDGTTLINDALVWGAAPGFDTIRFARAIDNDNTGGVSSITDHGRWQVGDFNTHIHKQTTVQERADSIVYGLTASQKGARWPRVVVEATVYEPLFQIGEVVTCEFHAYNQGTLRREPFYAPDGNAVSTGLVKIDLPLRKMMITFPTPTEAKFQLTLSREIDTPYDAYEFRFTRFDYPPPGGYVPRPPRIPGIPEPPCDCFGGGTVNRCELVQFDDFDRTQVSGWGNATPSGFTWATGGPGGSVSSVVPGYGKLEQDGFLTAGQTNKYTENGSDYWGSDFTMTLTFLLEDIPDPFYNASATWGLGFSSGFIGQGVGVHVAHPIEGDCIFFLQKNGTVTYVPFPLTESFAYNVEWVKSNNGADHAITVWSVGADKPSSPQISVTGDSTGTPTRWIMAHAGPTSIAPHTLDSHWKVWYSDLDFQSEDRPCYIDPDTGDPVLQVPEVPSSNEACEYATMIDTTHWQLVNKFVAGSSRVWIDGHQLRRGTAYDYVEYPSTGVIELLDPLYPPPTSFYVCYTAMGRV